MTIEADALRNQRFRAGAGREIFFLASTLKLYFFNSYDMAAYKLYSSGLIVAEFGDTDQQRRTAMYDAEEEVVRWNSLVYRRVA